MDNHGISCTGKVHTGKVHTGKVHTGKVHTGKVHTGKVHTGKVHVPSAVHPLDTVYNGVGEFCDHRLNRTPPPPPLPLPLTLSGPKIVTRGRH